MIRKKIHNTLFTPTLISLCDDCNVPICEEILKTCSLFHPSGGALIIVMNSGSNVMSGHLYIDENIQQNFLGENKKY